MYRLIISLLLLFTIQISGYSQNVPQALKDVNGVIDNTPDSIEKARTVRPVSGSSRKGDNPVLFLVGNSTMRTGTLGNGDNGQWGWGYFMQDFFDPDKITVENHALGGMSTRTFYKHLWKDVLKGVRKGDWVIIELGHNDNGPYDSGRARATIPGIGKEILPVVIKETGERDTVFSYGEYLRRYVKDVKRRGANPLLFSLTPRNAWEDKDSTVITRVNKTFGKWAKEIAKEENIPFVDLNDITATKYERFGKEKVKTMFYLDRIHTSEFGAKVNARSAVDGILGLQSSSLKDYLLPFEKDTLTGSTRKDGKPVLFVIGDSTVKNRDNGSDSQWGWGSVLSDFFDTSEISIENHAMAGRSARTFLDEGRWDKIYDALQPGDFVIMQFGHNDGGDINTGKARGELHGAGNESKVFKMEKTGRNQVIYTYGWYLKKFIRDAFEKGAVPIVLSHTPRNRWKDGIIESNASDFGLWAKQAALETGAYFIDLNTLSGDKLQALGEGNTSDFFKGDHTHTSLAGARLNAESIAEALRGLDCSLKDYLKPLVIIMTPGKKFPIYDEFYGAGYDFVNSTEVTGLDKTNAKMEKQKPYFVSARIPDGNYSVEATIGNKLKPSSTTIKAESRRLLCEEIKLDKGERKVIKFTVNKRNPAISLKDSVKLNHREIGSPTWDNKLTLEITGDAPAVERIVIKPVEPADSVTTIFLCGNSTVVDQTHEPWTSWGQIFPSFFNHHIAVANHAESGESASSFINSGRLDKVINSSSPGDWIFIEFGHNDQKERHPGSGAYYNFSTNLKIFIDRAREAGLNPVLITPAARRFFDKNGKIVNTHGDYTEAVREVARRENVPLIDLNAMTMKLYESLGPEDSKRAFVHYPAGSFPGQTSDLADNTHFNPYGADQLARCIAVSLYDIAPSLVKNYVRPIVYSSVNPDNPNEFKWIDTPFVDFTTPLGN